MKRSPKYPVKRLTQAEIEAVTVNAVWFKGGYTPTCISALRSTYPKWAPKFKSWKG